MANAIMNWTIIGHSCVPDVSGLPTRIQDIPKPILRMYGIVVDGDDLPSSDDEEDVLVIDEKICAEVDLTKPDPPVAKGRISSTANLAVPKKEIGRFKSGKLTELHVTDEQKRGCVSYCEICKKLVSDISIEEHKKKHCFQSGCLDMILDEVDRIRHLKMHDHPTKPFVCRWCKKRYRFYCNVDKHHKICKSIKKARDTWRKPQSSDAKLLT